jgi:very-short-patch-repair endonuclease
MAKPEFKTIEKNVTAFLDHCSAIAGKREEDAFNQGVWCEYQDLDISSPIEQVLYAAMRLVARVNEIDTSDPDQVDGELYVVGLDITPQQKIDKYRVDFLVTYYRFPRRDKDGKRQQEIRKVVVECDSQQWHERTERERRYEKARDRHLSINEYKVFHYTGAEILQDAFLIAAEVIGHVTGTKKEFLYESVTDMEANA